MFEGKLRRPYCERRLYMSNKDNAYHFKTPEFDFTKPEGEVSICCDEKGIEDKNHLMYDGKVYEVGKPYIPIVGKISRIILLIGSILAIFMLCLLMYGLWLDY